MQPLKRNLCKKETCILLHHTNLYQALNQKQLCQEKLPIAGSFPWDGVLEAMSSNVPFCTKFISAPASQAVG